VAQAPYRTEILGAQHDRAQFSCGVEPLDRYFQQQAGQDHRRGLAVPYVMVDQATSGVVGYYTLSSLSILPASLPEAVARRLPRYESLPGILIGRLAVDQRFQGQGVGRALLLDALRRSLDISRQVGAMAVVVDAKDDAARRFYERFAFTRFVDDEYRLHLATAAIAQLFTT
jgi:GNAT superfamily N-acetyltransferase